MGISGGELFSDIPEAIQFAQAVQDAIKNLPVENRKPSDFLHVGASILMAAAPLADKLDEQSKS